MTHVARARAAAGLVLALGAALAVGSAARAETYTFRLDPEATVVTFVLEAFLHQVHGSAKLARGEIRFDEESGEASGEVVVDATTAETGNEKRDRDLHALVLESGTYPEIVLAVDGYEVRFDPAAPNDVVVRARLRIHGDEHPLRLEMALTPAPADGSPGLVAGTTFTVPYVEWGMKDPSKTFLRVAKEVEVTIEARGELVSSAP